MKRIRFARHAKALVVESLEVRRLLASVSLGGGILKITGNKTSETVNIEQVSPGWVAVSGDGISGVKEFHNVLGLFVDMKGGDDEVNVGVGEDDGDVAVDFLLPAVIKLGNGNDFADLYINSPSSVTVDGGLQSGAGGQDDEIEIEGSLINVLTINTWAGDDFLLVTESAIRTLVANLGVFSLARGQTDADEVDINASAIGYATLLLGTAQASPQTPGDATALQLTPGFGNNVGVHSSLFMSLSIVGGNAVDNVVIDSDGEGLGATLEGHLVTLAEDLQPFVDQRGSRAALTSLLSGLDSFFTQLGGPDTFDASQIDPSDLAGSIRDMFAENPDLETLGDDTAIRSLSINTLGGADSVGLTDLKIGLLFVFLGDGTDTVEVDNVSARIAFFDGGNGFDTFVHFETSPNLGTRSLTIIHFEETIFPNDE